MERRATVGPFPDGDIAPSRVRHAGVTLGRAACADDGSRQREQATARIGHNGGPPLEPRTASPRAGGSVSLYRAWAKARRRAWREVPRDVMLLRTRRAAALGLSYREYTLEILERGRYLAEGDERVAAIKRARTRPTEAF